VIRGQCYRR